MISVIKKIVLNCYKCKMIIEGEGLLIEYFTDVDMKITGHIHSIHFHFLSGYCRIVLSGMNQERFLNLCAAKQILCGILKERESIIFFT